MLVLASKQSLSSYLHVSQPQASQPAATSSSAAADSNSLHSGSCNQCNETPNIEGGDASMEVGK